MDKNGVSYLEVQQWKVYPIEERTLMRATTDPSKVGGLVQEMFDQGYTKFEIKASV